MLGLKEVYFKIELVRENRHKTNFTIYQKKREWNAYQIWKFAGNFLVYEGRIKTIEGKRMSDISRWHGNIWQTDGRTWQNIVGNIKASQG